MPHPQFLSRVVKDFTSWNVKVLGGYQTIDYPGQPCDPRITNCLTGTVVMSCYVPPDIPLIKCPD